MNDDTLHTDVAIVGGGPAGMMLALELGRQGVACMLFEEDAQAPDYPKANANSARTMEHYRRHGIADRVRALGLAADHPQDVVYWTQLCGRELARFRIPSSAQAKDGSYRGDFDERRWPTAELPHRAQQMFIEPLLRDEVLHRHASIDARFGWRVEHIEPHDDHVALLARQADGGRTCRVRANYLVGCDGARSLVRHVLGIALSGDGGTQREFFGGMMASLHLRSPELTALLRNRRGWQHWVANPRRRGIVVAIDDDHHFVTGVQLAPGQNIEQLDLQAMLDDLVGQRFAYDNLGTGTWLAGYMLVADHYRQGRCLLAGDAAHLFTPAAGMGYNTGIDDVANLGWKLAAQVQGWAGPKLLDSYEAERHPIGLRNTAYGKAMADSMAALRPPPELEDDGARGEAARRDFAERCRAHLLREYQIPGLQLGLRYRSAIVADDGSQPPPDDPNRYEPGAWPGFRAPHSVGPDGVPIHDRFGHGFTLLTDASKPTDAWTRAAAQARIPLKIVPWPDPEARQLYGNVDQVLVRPDHHVAWRGSAAQDAVSGVLTKAVGW